MSNQSNKVTICLIMTCLLVLMPHSGFLANYDNSHEEIENKSAESYSLNFEGVWMGGEQPWPQSGKTPGRESTPPSHSPDGGAGIESPENNSELLSIVNPVINWQYSNYAFSTDALATPVADLSASIISDEESLERCGGDSLFMIIIQTEDVGGAPHSFLKIIEGEDADLAWEVDLGEISDSGRDEIKASPVVVDLDFDGKQEIIVSYDLSGTFYVKAFSPELICSVTGWSPGGSHVTELLWTYSDSTLMIGSDEGPYVGTTRGGHKPTTQPLLADLDLDGSAELVLSLIEKNSDEPVILALDITGTSATSLWEKTLDKGTHPSDPAFVQTDENTAFILLTSVQSSTSAMWLWKLDASDGDSNWDGKSLDNLNGFDSNVPHIRLPGPVIANLDSDTAMELVVTIPSDFDDSGAAYGAEYYGLEISDGTEIWDFEASNGYADSAPIVIDTDGDGDHDRVCWITWTVSGILETNFDGFAGCHDGTDGSNPQQAWSIEILEPQGAFNDGIAVSSPIWMDIDNSNEPELIVPYGTEVRAFDGELGTMAGVNSDWNNPIAINHRVWSSPSLADIDGDATLDLILGDTVISHEIADIRPQLDGRSIEFSPVAPDPGETVTITVSFENAGTAETDEDSDVILYADNEIIAQEKFGNMQPVDPTGSGSLSTFNVEWSGNLGEHEFKLVLDPYRNITQSRYDNDIHITTLNIVNPYNASFEIPTEPTVVTPGESSLFTPNIRSTGRLAGVWSLSVEDTNLPNGWAWSDETSGGIESIEIGVGEVWTPILRIDAPSDALGSDSGYLTLSLTLDDDNNVSISALAAVEANRTRGLSIRGPDGTANTLGYGLTGEYAEAWILIHNLGNALENQIIMSWDSTTWGTDLKLYDLEGNHIPALSLEPDEMIYVTARLEVPSNANLGDTVSTPLTMCVSVDPEICQTIDISFTATGVTTGIHQRTVPGTTLTWDVSADMPIGENQLEWSMTDAGLIIPGWSWSTTGDLEIIDDSLILTRSGSSRVYGTIILELPIEAFPSYHTFFEQSSQSTDHLLQFSLEVLQIYRADLTITSPLEQPYEVEVEEDVLIMVKLENPGNGLDTFRLSSELVTSLDNDEEFEVTVSFTSSSVSLGSGSLQTIPVIVRLPENTPANTEIEIRFIMTSQGNQSVQDTEIVSLSAKQDHRWEINGEYQGNSIRNNTIITAPGDVGEVILEAKNIGNLEDDISLETSINIIYSGLDNSQGWNASGTSIEGVEVNQTGNPSVSWSVPNGAWNGTVMQITVNANSRGEIIDTITFNIEVPHIKEWRAISSQVDLEIDPEGSSIDIEILQLGNSPSNAYSTVYVNGSNDWIVETPDDLPVLSPGESAFMTLNITPPENAQHGKTVELHIRLREGISLSETIVPLRVAVIHEFELSGQGPWVISEQGGFPHATLLNEGNAPTTITINVRSLPSGWEVVGETTTVLAVGELKGLPIELIPDPNWVGEVYTIKIEAIDDLGNVDEILLDTIKQDYSWGMSPIITMVSGDNTLMKIHGTNSESSVIDGSQGLLNWDNNGGWLWLASQSVQDGEITIDSNEGLVYSSYISEKVSRNGNCHLSGIQGDITAYCSINNGTGIFDYTFLLIDDNGKLLDSYSGTLDENTSLEIFNLTATSWNPEPGKRNLLLRALDSRGVEFTSTEKEFDIRRSDWNVGLTGIELVGTGSNQQVKITTIRENQNLLNDADCLLRVTSEAYDEEYVMNPSGVYFLPKIDRPNLPDGNELIVRFSCAFPWDVESDSTDNEQRIILEDGSDNNDGIEDLETGIAAAALVIGLSVALAWLVKNHRERKEMMEITEKAIKQHLSSSDKKNTKDNFVEERKEKIEQDVEIVENVNEETLRIDEKDEEVEEELDEFELRLRRLGKL